MTLHLLLDHPDDRQADALATFEQEFTYPLGAGRRFHIAHGRDCWRFFRALGDAAYALVERDQRVVGALGAALRRVVQPDGREAAALYVGDLKIATDARNGLVLIRLLRAVTTWVGQRTAAAFSVVMDGTAQTPTAYTGRAGVPAFHALDAIAVLWLRTDGGRTTSAPVHDGQGLAAFTALAAGRYHLPHADPTMRSVLTPRWLVTDNGDACGRLEDTLRAKRLHTTDGAEMRSAHLSCFAYRTVAAGLPLLSAVWSQAADAGHPMLFVAVPAGDAPAWQRVLGERLRTIAPATVFGTGLAMPGQWLINTADI